MSVQCARQNPHPCGQTPGTFRFDETEICSQHIVLRKDEDGNLNNTRELYCLVGQRFRPINSSGACMYGGPGLHGNHFAHRHEVISGNGMTGRTPLAPNFFCAPAHLTVDLPCAAPGECARGNPQVHLVVDDAVIKASVCEAFSPPLYPYMNRGEPIAFSNDIALFHTQDDPNFGWLAVPLLRQETFPKYGVIGDCDDRPGIGVTHRERKLLQQEYNWNNGYKSHLSKLVERETKSMHNRTILSLGPCRGNLQFVVVEPADTKKKKSRLTLQKFTQGYEDFGFSIFELQSTHGFCGESFFGLNSIDRPNLSDCVIGSRGGFKFVGVRAMHVCADPIFRGAVGVDATNENFVMIYVRVLPNVLEVFGVNDSSWVSQADPVLNKIREYVWGVRRTIGKHEGVLRKHADEGFDRAMEWIAHKRILERKKNEMEEISKRKKRLRKQRCKPRKRRRICKFNPGSNAAVRDFISSDIDIE